MMRMFAKIGVMVLAVALAGTLTLKGQSVAMASWLDNETVEQLGEANAMALKSKVSRIITRNGAVDAAGLFAVVPTLFITDEDEVNTGMTTLRVVKADLTLSVKNLYENAVFANQTVQLQAQGGTREAVMRSLINKVNVNDVRFAKMIVDVQQSITDYYANLMPQIMAKANSLAARQEWEDAMAVLAVVPESVAEYETVAQMQVDIYNKMTAEHRRVEAHTDSLANERANIEKDVRQQLKAEENVRRQAKAEEKVRQRTEVKESVRQAEAKETVLPQVKAGESVHRQVKTEEGVRRQAVAEAQRLKEQRAERSAKQGSSFSAWLFGL